MNAFSIEAGVNELLTCSCQHFRFPIHLRLYILDNHIWIYSVFDCKFSQKRRNFPISIIIYFLKAT